MKNSEQQLEAIRDIRKMMKESSRFLSLSGLSGVLAGVFALAGAWLGYHFISDYYSQDPAVRQESAGVYEILVLKVASVCFAVLVLSITSAICFSAIKAKRNNLKLIDHTSKKLIWSMAVPLVAGGIFCIALSVQGNGYVSLVSPAMLIFYGLALVNGSRFTPDDVKYLGYLEITLGLAASFMRGHDLLFWSLGFGVLHIIYGSIVWFKYDRNPSPREIAQ
jgi:hypothetical protein